MVLTVVAILLAMTGAGASLNESVLAWGGGMWSLLELAMQFAIAMVAAHACVSSRPVFRLLDRLASLPNPQRPLQLHPCGKCQLDGKSWHPLPVHTF